jgi:1-aminocyclopropane-1-carboxylate deaminase
MKVADLFHNNRSVLERLEHPLFTAHNTQVMIKRDDLIDELVSGNKWRKLKYNLLQMESLGKSGVLTFGGAYSNHLIATAKAANRAGVKSIGIVRGDELNPASNETLKQCDEFGMKLVFVSREEYANRNDPEYLSVLKTAHNDLYLIPEGGANFYGMIGCQEIVKEIDQSFNAIFVAQGTTTTSCGIASVLDNSTLYVVPVLKGFDSIREMGKIYDSAAFDTEFIDELNDRTIVLSEYHFNGYGKYTPELLEFIQMIYLTTGLKLDPIYTGKAFFALFDMVKVGAFDDQTVVFVHTGGLNGVKGVEERSGVQLFD